MGKYVCELFKSKCTLFASSDQSHIQFQFYVPKLLDHLIVQLHYDPPHLKEEQDDLMLNGRSAFYDFNIHTNSKAKEKIFPLNNLITLSIDDPVGFRGSCHRHQPNLEVRMTNHTASLGIISRPLEAGMWAFTVSCHAIVTEQINVTFTVLGESEQKINKRWQCKPFEHECNSIKLREGKDISPDKENARWIKSEIHTHTNHSDGTQTAEQLINEAVKRGIECLAITDHNTMSGLQELEKIDVPSSLHVIKGNEWTTFYGHMLTLGYESYTTLNWIESSPIGLDEMIHKIKAEKAIVGIAHPFRPGAPFCTGCNWEYITKNIHLIDFIEVWNGENPHKDKFNQKAFNLWTKLLNEGHELPATYGRDWHHQRSDKSVAALYLFVKESYKLADIRQAITQGCSYVTLQPKVNVMINEMFMIGDKIDVSLLEMNFLSLHAQVEEMSDGDQIIIDSNNGELYRAAMSEFTVEVTNLSELKYVRVLIYNKHHELICFTNPIYVTSSNAKREKSISN